MPRHKLVGFVTVTPILLRSKAIFRKPRGVFLSVLIAGIEIHDLVSMSSPSSCFSTPWSRQGLISPIHMRCDGPGRLEFTYLCHLDKLNVFPASHILHLWHMVTIMESKHFGMRMEHYVWRVLVGYLTRKGSIVLHFLGLSFLFCKFKSF